MFKDKRVCFAEAPDEERLREMLWYYGMDIPGKAEEQLVFKVGGQILASAHVMEYEPGHFYLVVIGVCEGGQGKGYGGILLKEIVADPWQCCKNRVSDREKQRDFRITTLARGEAARFYAKYGFVPCRMDEIPKPFQEQCDVCQNIEECRPQTMIFKDGRHKE